MKNLNFKNWWWEALKGTIAIFIGIVAFSNTEKALVAIATYFGIFAIAIGVFLVVISMAKKGKNWQFWLGEGIFDAIIGILIISYPEISMSVLIIFVSIWIIIIGVIQLIAYNRLKGTLKKRGVVLFSSIISLVFGIVLLFNPFEGAKLAGFALGIYAIIYGVSSLYISFKLARTF